MDLFNNVTLNEDDIIAHIDMRDDKHELVKRVDSDGNTPLMHTLYWRTHRRSATKLVEYLLELGSDPNVVNKYLGTPLERACWSVDLCSLPVYKIVHLILSYGADPNKTNRSSVLYRCVLHESQASMCAIALHGGQMTDSEYNYLIEKEKIGMLVKFYDNLRLSHLSYTHVKRMRHHIQ